jgi:hypothetical protein
MRQDSPYSRNRSTLLSAIRGKIPADLHPDDGTLDPEGRRPHAFDKAAQERRDRFQKEYPIKVDAADTEKTKDLRIPPIHSISDKVTLRYSRSRTRRVSATSRNIARDVDCIANAGGLTFGMRAFHDRPRYYSALHDGRYVYSSAIVAMSPLWPALAKGTGIDFVFVDTEHIPLDRQTLSWILQTYKAMGLPRSVRLPCNDPFEACKVLDAARAA